MKVHIYGNTLNSGYNLARHLLERGIKVEFFLDDFSSSNQDYPWWDDPSIGPLNLPHWTRYYKTRPFFLFPSKETRRMINDFSKCDVALVTCWGPILAMKSKVPFVFISLGSDLNSISIIDELKSVFFASLSIKKRFQKLVKIITYSPLQRKALIRYSSKIVIAMGYQYNQFIVRFNLQNKTLLWCYPKDVKGYGVDIDFEVLKDYNQFDLIFFMFSRQSWHSVWNDFKGNDKFFIAYAKFVKDYKPNVKLYVPRKGIDVAKSSRLLKSLDIEDYYEWFDDMPKFKLKKIQALPHVVMVDNFWHDEWRKRFPLDINPKVGFGFGSIESLASKSMLITAFTDVQFYDGNYPPILHAFSIEEIYSRLVEIYHMPDLDRMQMKNKGYEFVMKWHEQSNIIFNYINLLKEACEAGF